MSSNLAEQASTTPTPDPSQPFPSAPINATLLLAVVASFCLFRCCYRRFCGTKSGARRRTVLILGPRKCHKTRLLLALKHLAHAKSDNCATQNGECPSFEKIAENLNNEIQNQFTCASLESNHLNLNNIIFVDIPGDTRLAKLAETEKLLRTKISGLIICYDRSQSEMLNLAQTMAEVSQMQDVSKLQKFVLTNDDSFDKNLLKALQLLAQDSPELLLASKSKPIESVCKNIALNVCDFEQNSILRLSNEILNWSANI